MFKQQFRLWIINTIKNQLMKKEDLEVDFCILMIKLKLCGWLSHEWTQICEKKELICKRCEKINLF